MREPKDANDVSSCMTDKLPAWETGTEDRKCFRFWKRLLHHAGKRRAFDVIEPVIRELAKKIRNRPFVYDDTSSTFRPTDRKRKLFAAFDEIRNDDELVVATEIAEDASDLVTGVTGQTQFVLLAGACLIQAMFAKRQFEHRLMGCLTMLEAIDVEFVNEIGRQLREKAK
ncbi:MAG TPA: hypothetical protein VLA12_05085 [Planctomycetaceae bacterium]|nr:hypothetical protein [Planctomycetaceae bacterium]